jgi:hypothetical protein
VEDLVGRLAALDPDAGAALKVIAYFDRLVEGRAGLEPIVRGAAVLTGVPARLVWTERRVSIGVGPDGVLRKVDGEPDPAWASTPLSLGGPPVLWLERQGPVSPVEAMVLERAASAARGVFYRTGGPAAVDDIQVVLDENATERDRLRAARGLGLGATAMAVAWDGGRPEVASVEPAIGHGRAGIGPTVPIAELPASWAAARTALRFTSEGTEQDPGPRVVRADELGGLAVLANGIGKEPIQDVRDLERARSTAPWALATLEAVATSPSLRTAATSLVVHHSTLQDRLSRLEDLLGWSVRDPQGRLRLQLALALRRLRQHPEQT